MNENINFTKTLKTFLTRIADLTNVFKEIYISTDVDATNVYYIEVQLDSKYIKKNASDNFSIPISEKNLKEALNSKEMMHKIRHLICIKIFEEVAKRVRKEI